MNGLVERAIRTIQDSLQECGLKKFKLHATGLQTFCKLVENQLNNLPLGFKHSRDADNSELFKILTPNHLKHGRNNSRSLDGPVRLPGNLSEMSQRVTDIYQAWFKIWSSVAVPKLAQRTKWFQPERNLEVGDIVYYQKDSSGLDSSWTTGMVDEIVVGTDGLVREAVVRYRNFSEEFYRFTTRAARSLVRLCNIDDQNLADDLHELTERLSMVEGGDDLVGLLSTLGEDNSKQDGSDQSEPSINLSNFSNLCSSVTGSTTDDLARTGQSVAQAGILATILTPRSRSPLGQSREDDQVLARALLAHSVQTPVIVCNEPAEHTSQALGCLTATRARSLSPASGRLSDPPGIPASSSANTLLQVPPPTVTISQTSANPTTPFGRSQPPSTVRRKLTAKCRQCCCDSHHRLADHKLKRGKIPSLACDLSDLRLTFCDQVTGLKGPEKFESVNQMIWSCELDLKK
jgi:hypothetical protein